MGVLFIWFNNVIWSSLNPLWILASSQACLYKGMYVRANDKYCPHHHSGSHWDELNHTKTKYMKPHMASVPFMTPLSDQPEDHRQLCEWHNIAALTLRIDVGIVASLVRTLQFLKKAKDFSLFVNFDCFTKRKANQLRNIHLKQLC